MTPEKLRLAGWSVMEWPDGQWSAYRAANPLVIMGWPDGSVVYAVPQSATQVKAVKGFGRD